MSKKTFNTSLVLVVVAMLVVFACYVRIGSTADAVVVLKTSGMSCDNCIAKVTKALQSERGVAATEVDLARGCVIAGYDSKQVAPEKLAQKVVAAGYRSTVQAVLTPEQYRKSTGRDVGNQTPGMMGCCGAGGCRGK